MREGIHPKYHDVEARCACGATWKTRSTKPELHLEICSSCHPFFTGKQKLLDTEGRVERFTKKYGAQTSRAARSRGKKAAKAKKAAAGYPLAQQFSEASGLADLSLDPREPLLRRPRIFSRATRSDARVTFSAANALADARSRSAMLVVNRQRLDRLALHLSAAPRLDQRDPAARRLVISAQAPVRRAPATVARRHAAPPLAGPSSSRQERSRARTRRSARCVSRPRAYTWPSASASREFSAQSGPPAMISSSRDVRPASESEIAAVVLEDARQEARVARSQELKVPRRDFEARHIVLAPRAEDLLLEHAERALVFLPEPSRRMQDVDVRLRRRDPVEPVKQIPRFEHRRVE